MRSKTDSIRVIALGARRAQLAVLISQADPENLTELQMELADILEAKLGIDARTKAGELQLVALDSREIEIGKLLDSIGSLSQWQAELVENEAELKNIDPTITTLEEDKPLWNPVDDLNEKIWLDWNAAQLPDGEVAAWTGAAWTNGSTPMSVLATQDVPANRPVKAADGVVFSGAAKTFSWPNQGDESTRTNRVFLMMFKAAVATAPSADGLLFASNGAGGSGDERCPAVTYSKTSARFVVYWSPSLALLIPKGDDLQWHVLASWRINGVAYASLDGGPPVASADTNVSIPRNGTNGKGVIGDTRATSINWTCKRIFMLQGEPTLDQMHRHIGWAMWEMGAQAQLPADHPYRSARPKTERYVCPRTFQTAADWDGIDEYWAKDADSSSEILKDRGKPFTMADGFTETFRDDFDRMSIANERDDPSTYHWFAPVHSAPCGAATARRPNQLPAVFSQGNTGPAGESCLRITLQKSGATWYSGAFCSVNLDGRGRVWNPRERPLYVEMRIQCPIPAAGSVESWPAGWLKDQDEFSMRTFPRTEIDFYEGYSDDADGWHGTVHQWPPLRQYNERHHVHELASLINQMTNVSWPNAPAYCFDGNMHRYGCYIDRRQIIMTFDGLIVTSAPVWPLWLRPLYILVDLALYQDKGGTESTYMDIDWISVKQGALY